MTGVEGGTEIKDRIFLRTTGILLKKIKEGIRVRTSDLRGGKKNYTRNYGVSDVTEDERNTLETLNRRPPYESKEKKRILTVSGYSGNVTR